MYTRIYIPVNTHTHTHTHTHTYTTCPNDPLTTMVRVIEPNITYVCVCVCVCA